MRSGLAARQLPARFVLLVVFLGACSAPMPDALHPEQPVPDAPPAFIDATEAAIFIGHEGAFFLDARPAELYRKGHVPGAVQLDFTTFAERSVYKATGTDAFDVDTPVAVFGERGLRADHWAILVGDPASVWGEEAHVAYLLRTMGHTKVSIVDGGWTAWQAAGLPTQNRRVHRAAAVYEARARSELRASMAEVRDWAVDRLPSWQRVIVDARSFEEYAALPGAPPYGAVRAGHIPGAVNLPWSDLLDEQGRVLPADALETVLIGRGVRPDARIITYCTGGARSAYVWYVLDSLGYPSVRQYAGSFWEWALDRRNPVRPGSGRLPPPAPPWPPETSSETGRPSPAESTPD